MSVCVISPASPSLLTTGRRRTFMLSTILIASSRVASSLMLVMFFVIALFALSLEGSFFSFSTRCTRSRSVIMPMSCFLSSTTKTQLIFFSVMSLTALSSLSFALTLIAPVVMISFTSCAGGM